MLHLAIRDGSSFSVGAHHVLVVEKKTRGGQTVIDVDGRTFRLHRDDFVEVSPGVRLGIGSKRRFAVDAPESVRVARIVR